jgi:hypothetical protein
MCGWDISPVKMVEFRSSKRAKTESACDIVMLAVAFCHDKVFIRPAINTRCNAVTAALTRFDQAFTFVD